MAEIEKVIKDLEEYRDRDFIREGITVFDSNPRYRKMIINNAIALLKEYKRQDGCPCTHCMEWECDEVCEKYKKWKDT